MAHYHAYTTEDFMEMTVGRVFWHFDCLAAYIRLTNPFGSGEETSSQASVCASCHETGSHALDCPKRIERHAPRQATGGSEGRIHESGFDTAASLYDKGLNVNGGIDVKTMDQVRIEDPMLADLIDEFNAQGR